MTDSAKPNEQINARTGADAIPQTMTAIRHHEFGGPEVLILEDGVPVPAPGAGQLLVHVSAIGLNFVDTYLREGIYDTDLPNIPGREGAGTVVGLGSSISDAIAVGDRIAFSEAAATYAEYCVVDADRAVKVPDSLSDEEAASILLQGTTAHALATGVYPLDETSICVITAGAGGVGQLLTRMAKHLGAKVISLVGSEDKQQIARDCGADEVIGYEDYSGETVRALAARLREVSGVEGESGADGVDVVFDGVGKSTFDASLDCIRPRGLMCLFGAASGPVPPMDPQELNRHGSLFLTRPSVTAWTSKPGEYQQRAGEVLRWVDEGVLNINIGATYSLADAATAQDDLEHRRTTGSVVIKQDV